LPPARRAFFPFQRVWRRDERHPPAAGENPVSGPQARPARYLQVNLGYRCNQSCLHCHVNAGPNRTEMMDDATLALIPQVLAARSIRTLDLTGGAPELHEGFGIWCARPAPRACA
jgi:molybdenum cofactor biosynthesis enzyme MoaA